MRRAFEVIGGAFGFLLLVLICWAALPLMQHIITEVSK